jgi:hypothetical protein
VILFLVVAMGLFGVLLTALLIESACARRRLRFRPDLSSAVSSAIGAPLLSSPTVRRTAVQALQVASRKELKQGLRAAKRELRKDEQRLRRCAGRKILRRALKARTRRLKAPIKRLKKDLRRQMRRLAPSVQKHVRQATRRLKRLGKMMDRYKGQLKELRSIARQAVMAVVSTLIPALKGVRLAAFAAAIAQTLQWGVKGHKSGMKIRDGLKGDGWKVMEYIRRQGLEDAKDLDKAVEKMFQLWVEDPSASLIGIKDTVLPFQKLFKKFTETIVSGFKKGQEVVGVIAQACDKGKEIRDRLSGEVSDTDGTIRGSCQKASDVKIANVQKTLETLVINSLTKNFEVVKNDFIKSMTKRMTIAAVTGA